MNPPDWQRRRCPLCGEAVTRPLVSPTVAAVVDANDGYTAAVRDRLCSTIGERTELPVVACTRCGFAFAALTPPAEVLASVYGEPASTAAAKAKAQVPEKRLRRLDDWHRMLRSQPDRPALSVVDYGCGWGAFLDAARSPGVRVVGIEPFPRVGPDANDVAPLAMVRSASDLEESFDLFMCDQVLEHVLDPVASARDLRSVLRPGALGVLGVPNFGRFDWAGERRRLAGGAPVSTKDLNPIEHVNYFTGRHLAATLRAAGFEPVARPGLGRLDGLEQRVLDRVRVLRRRPSTHRFARAAEVAA